MRKKRKKKNNHSKIIPIILSILILSLFFVYFVSALTLPTITSPTKTSPTLELPGPGISPDSPKMVVHLGFEGNLNDKTVNQNHGSFVFIRGITDLEKFAAANNYESGKKGQALKFNGKYSVALPDKAKVGNLQKFTIMAWVKPDSSSGKLLSGSSLVPIISEHNKDIVGRYILGFEQNKYVFHPNLESENLNSKNDEFNGKWMHITAISNKEADKGEIKLYLNGIEIDNSEYAIELYGVESNYRLLIGGSDGVNKITELKDQSIFGGLIDEVKIFNYALGIEQIKQEVGTCNSDTDCDGILDNEDNCVNMPNPSQKDSDSNEVGDACDTGVSLPDPNLGPGDDIIKDPTIIEPQLPVIDPTLIIDEESCLAQGGLFCGGGCGGYLSVPTEIGDCCFGYNEEGTEFLGEPICGGNSCSDQGGIICEGVCGDFGDAVDASDVDPTSICCLGYLDPATADPETGEPTRVNPSCETSPASETCEYYGTEFGIGATLCTGKCLEPSIDITEFGVEPPLDTIEGVICCVSENPEDAGCQVSEFVSALGESVQVTRTPCIDEDGDGEGYSIVRAPTSYFEAVGIETEGEEYQEPCATLPRGSSPGETVSFVSYWSIVIMLMVLLVYYRKKLFKRFKYNNK